MVSKARDAVHQKPPDEDTTGPRPGHTLVARRVYPRRPGANDPPDRCGELAFAASALARSRVLPKLSPHERFLGAPEST